MLFIRYEKLPNNNILFVHLMSISFYRARLGRIYAFEFCIDNYKRKIQT